jgi:hypothetical protein
MGRWDADRFNALAVWKHGTLADAMPTHIGRENGGEMATKKGGEKKDREAPCEKQRKPRAGAEQSKQAKQKRAEEHESPDGMVCFACFYFQ